MKEALSVPKPDCSVHDFDTEPRSQYKRPKLNINAIADAQITHPCHVNIYLYYTFLYPTFLQI